jgi:hypothetical protein
MLLVVEQRQQALAVAKCGVEPLDVAWSCQLDVSAGDLSPRSSPEAVAAAIVGLDPEYSECNLPAVSDTMSKLLMRRFHETGSADETLSEVMKLYLTRSHELRQTPSGIEVREPENWTPYEVDAPDELKRVVADSLRALSTPVVGWPGRTAASRPRLSLQRAPELEAALATLINLKLHDWPTQTAVQVLLRGERPEAWGQALAFDVQLNGTAQSAGPCPTWASSAAASGELVVRAMDGAFIALHLAGPLTDAQRNCTKAGARNTRSTSEGSALTTCNRGELRIDVGWAHYQEVPADAGNWRSPRQ